MPNLVALAHIVQRRGGSLQTRWRSPCEPKGSLHLGTTECAFSVTKSSQPGLQLGPPALGRTPQLALGLLAAAAALALHLGGAAFALTHLQSDEVADELGAPAIEVGLEMMAPKVEATDLPPGHHAVELSGGPERTCGASVANRSHEICQGADAKLAAPSGRPALDTAISQTGTTPRTPLAIYRRWQCRP